MHKNKRYELKEAEDQIEELSLKDILDVSVKAEAGATKLLSASINSSNKRLQSLATKFKSVANEISVYISKLIMSGGLDTEEDTRVALESKSFKESAKQKYMKRKKLKESADGEKPVEENSYQDYMKEDNEPETENNNPADKMEDKAVGEKTNTEVTIDLTEPFEKVIEGLDSNEFGEFKSSVVAKLEDAIDTVEAKTDEAKADEYARSIEALSATSTPEDFDDGMSRIYDFADTNGIMVETVKKVAPKTTKKKKK